MIILLAPSKTMDFTSPLSKSIASTNPIFSKEAAQIAKDLSKLSQSQLASHMKISERLAAQNYHRYQNFNSSNAPSKKAIFTYQGDVYRDIHPEKYTPSQLDYAQKHLRILSGLYGILRPLDLIKPYRLEMKLQNAFWKEKLTSHIQEQILESSKTQHIIIALSSKEYLNPINFKELAKEGTKIITPIFKTGDRVVPIFSKIARGSMANWIIKNQLTDPAKLQNFKEDGWQFSPKDSNDSELVFSRDQK